MKKTCLECGKEFEYKHSIPPGYLEEKAKVDNELYEYLVCSDECLVIITDGEITMKREALFDMEIKLYDHLDSIISTNPEFTYMIIDKLEYDEQKSNDEKMPLYLVEWGILRINSKGKMTINEPVDNIKNSFDYSGAWYSDIDLGLLEKNKLESVSTGWNNVQYIKAQKDKNQCDAELVKYSNSDVWKIRKKYFDNVLTTFREWFRVNKHTPPDLDTYVEPKKYTGRPKSPKVIRLLELANELGLKTGDTIPKAVKIEMAETLKAENFGEISLEYIRRTLTKYYYSSPKTYDAEWGDLPLLKSTKGTYHA